VVTVSVVGFGFATTVAAAPPIVTVVEASKPDPRIVTVVPPTVPPTAGVTDAIDGCQAMTPQFARIMARFSPETTPSPLRSPR
jgi:hypothetical protein